MNTLGSKVRVLVALAAAACCAAALDAAVALADGQPATRPTTAPSLQPMAAVPTTSPVLVGGAIGNDYARPVLPVAQVPELQSKMHGGSSTDTPAAVIVGGGVDAGQRVPQAVGTPPVATGDHSPVVDRRGVAPATTMPSTPQR